VATLLELSFPLCAILVNEWFLGIHLQYMQFAAASVLIFAILKIGRMGSTLAAEDGKAS